VQDDGPEHDICSAQVVDAFDQSVSVQPGEQLAVSNCSFTENVYDMMQGTE
jgi:hypothetical protein